MGASWLTTAKPGDHELLLIEMGGRWQAQCSCGWHGSPSQPRQEDVEAEFALHVDLARLPATGTRTGSGR